MFPARPQQQMRLPIEVVEGVIDALRADAPALTTCSLVCKQWLPRSRHHLFSSLDLSADWTPEPNTVTKFIQLIVDTPTSTSTLIPYVTGVVLSKRSWGMTPVHKILSVLASVGLQPCFLHINCPTYEPTHLPMFSLSLVHLALYLHTDTSLSTVIDHISAFPHLESLLIGGSARYTTLNVPSTPSSTVSPRLQKLILGNTKFLEWLLWAEPIPTHISTLVLRDIKSPHQWATISAYLASPAALAMRSLTLQGCELDPAQLHQPSDAYTLDALQHLTVEHPSVGAATSTLLTLLRFLSPTQRAVLTPSVSELESVSIYTGATNGGGRFRAAPWHALDELLSPSLPTHPKVLTHTVHHSRRRVAPFPRLERLSVRIRVRAAELPEVPVDYVLPQALAGEVTAQMAGCIARGVLNLG